MSSALPPKTQTLLDPVGTSHLCQKRSFHSTDRRATRHEHDG
jgi:hypothetical protein